VPSIRVNGAQLYYEESGHGEECVVFVHGLAWGIRLFRHQVSALNDHYRCIAYDSRGHGRSEITRAGYELDNLSADLTELIEKRGAAPCHLVGHSIGGSVAFRVAARKPELVRSLVLFNSAVDEDPLWIRIKYWVMSFGVQGLGMRFAGGEMIKAQFGKTFLADPAREAEREEFRRLFASQNKYAIAHAVRGWIRSSPAEAETSRVAAPTIVIVGDEDRTVRAASSRLLADSVQRGRFLVLPRCGHSAPVEAPAAATEALRDFLNNASTSFKFEHAASGRVKM
jgi:pimeloyl-ACP methyl ester carboxylesterase